VRKSKSGRLLDGRTYDEYPRFSTGKREKANSIRTEVPESLVQIAM
jgi:hypothetical protein